MELDQQNRKRRSKAEMAALSDALTEIVDDHQPCSVRQVFYLATTRGLVPKTEAAYRSVARILKMLRLAGDIDFRAITDSTRWMRKPTSFQGLPGFLDRMQRNYRRDLWAEQDVIVEIWLEKDALAGVVYGVTAKYDVPLMVTRGYPSLSFLGSAAEALEAEWRPAYLYYFGDHDPSGVDISRHTEKQLRELAPSADITFERVAVIPAQIEAWKLPTRPTKKTDTRAKRFKGESVELDALKPERLRRLVRDCIERHIDPDILEGTRRVEAAERATLREMALTFGSNGRQTLGEGGE